MFFDLFEVFFFRVGFIQDVIFLVFGVDTAEAPLAVPDVSAPVAVRDPIGPVDVATFVQKAAKTAVVALFQRVCDRSAVGAVFAAAFQTSFGNIETVLAVV